MKKIVFLLIFMCATLSGFAQDIKYKNGELIVTHPKVVQDCDRFIYSGDSLKLDAKSMFVGKTGWRNTGGVNLEATDSIYYFKNNGLQRRKKFINAQSGYLLLKKSDEFVYFYQKKAIIYFH